MLNNESLVKASISGSAAIAKTGNKIGDEIIFVKPFVIFIILLLIPSTNDKPLPNIEPIPDVNCLDRKSVV